MLKAYKASVLVTYYCRTKPLSRTVHVQEMPGLFIGDPQSAFFISIWAVAWKGYKHQNNRGSLMNASTCMPFKWMWVLCWSIPTNKSLTFHLAPVIHLASLNFVSSRLIKCLTVRIAWVKLCSLVGVDHNTVRTLLTSTCSQNLPNNRLSLSTSGHRCSGLFYAKRKWSWMSW